MSAIFISHAVADQKLAHMLTNFLKEAIGVKQGDIFASSVDGHSIPFGEDFNDYIKEKIQEPQLVILLLTPAYLESAFCLMELGATWAASHNTLPIVVPPVDFDFVTRTLGLKQAWKITASKNLIGLKEMIERLVPNREERSLYIFEEKKEAWLLALDGVLKGLSGASKVDVKIHNEVLEQLEELQAKNDALVKARERDAERIVALEAAKDPAAVRQIRREFTGGEDPEKRFDEIMKAIREAMPSVAARVVKTHIALEFFRQEPTIDWENFQYEFTQALEFKLLKGRDDGYAVDWDRAKLKPAQQALRELEVFLESEEASAFVAEQNRKGVVMEPDDLEFWQKHLW